MVRRLLGPAIVLAMLLGFGVPAAFADDAPSPSYYLALGDSLAAGYQPVSPLDRDQGYVARLYHGLATRIPNLDLENLGCDGATTTSLLTGVGSRCAYGDAASQLAAAEHFLRDHRGRVRLITIDIGGNDINRCAAGGTIDATCAAGAIGTIATNLSEILRRLRTAAPGIPIIGMTYYDPYLAAWLSPGGIDLAKRSVDLTTQLNQQLTKLYTTGPNARVADVEGAFDTTDLTTIVPLPPSGVQVPLAVAQICRLTWMCLKRDIHPNSTGYQVIAMAFLAEIPGYSTGRASGLTDATP